MQNPVSIAVVIIKQTSIVSRKFNILPSTYNWFNHELLTRKLQKTMHINYPNGYGTAAADFERTLFILPNLYS